MLPLISQLETNHANEEEDRSEGEKEGSGDEEFDPKDPVVYMPGRRRKKVMAKPKVKKGGARKPYKKVGPAMICFKATGGPSGC